MGQIGSTIKNNIVNRNNKYKLDQEKVGKILEVSNNNIYTISVINRDGINTVEYNVPIRKINTATGLTTWEPKVGQLVTVQESNQRFVITGVYDDSVNASTKYDIYSDSYNGTSGSGNYLGY